VISAATAVYTSIASPGVYSGLFPPTPHATWARIAVELRRLGEIGRRLRAVERNAAAAAAPGDRPKEES
jgi:UDP-3-O-[3-hydroxymyristoyl] glucosamine N-acyltransferase